MYQSPRIGAVIRICTKAEAYYLAKVSIPSNRGSHSNQEYNHSLFYQVHQSQSPRIGAVIRMKL